MQLSQSNYQDLKKRAEFAEQARRRLYEPSKLEETSSWVSMKLTEQFGDNFKKLNEAVFELVRLKSTSSS